MDAGGVNEAPLTVEAEDESWVEAGVKLKALNSDGAELTEAAFLGGGPAPSSETIFIPTEVPVLAGINRVVTPFFLMTVRCG